MADAAPPTAPVTATVTLPAAAAPTADSVQSAATVAPAVDAVAADGERGESSDDDDGAGSSSLLDSVLPINKLLSGGLAAGSFLWSSWGAVKSSAEDAIDKLKHNEVVERVRASSALF